MSRLVLLLTLLLASPAWAQTETVGEIVSGTVVRGEIAPVGGGTSGTQVVIDVPPGLILWLDSDDPAAVSVDGSNRASAWVDKSGNGFGPLAQPTDDNKPMLTAASINGRAVLIHDGSNDYLFVDTPLVTDYPLTVYLVARIDNGAGFSGHFVLCDKDTADDVLWVTSSTGSTPDLRLIAVNSGSVTAGGGDVTPLATAFQYTGRAIANNDRRGSLNGAAGSDSTDLKVAENWDRTVIGYRVNASPFGPLYGAEAEVLVTDRDNTAAVQAQVRAYQRAKWDTP